MSWLGQWVTEILGFNSGKNFLEKEKRTEIAGFACSEQLSLQGIRRHEQQVEVAKVSQVPRPPPGTSPGTSPAWFPASVSLPPPQGPGTLFPKVSYAGRVSSGSRQTSQASSPFCDSYHLRILTNMLLALL